MFAVYTYSASHSCLGCGGLGDPHWIDMCETSPTYGLCTECRNPSSRLNYGVGGSVSTTSHGSTPNRSLNL